MSKQVPSREQLDMATDHASGDVEYGVYIEIFTGMVYEFDGIPDNAREVDCRSFVSPHPSLESALAGKESAKGRPFVHNVHVVQRKVSPWEVKEND